MAGDDLLKLFSRQVPLASLKDTTAPTIELPEQPEGFPGMRFAYQFKRETSDAVTGEPGSPSSNEPEGQLLLGYAASSRRPLTWLHRYLEAFDVSLQEPRASMGTAPFIAVDRMDIADRTLVDSGTYVREILKQNALRDSKLMIKELGLPHLALQLEAAYEKHAGDLENRKIFALRDVLKAYSTHEKKRGEIGRAFANQMLNAGRECDTARINFLFDVYDGDEKRIAENLKQETTAEKVGRLEASDHRYAQDKALLADLLEDCDSEAKACAMWAEFMSAKKSNEGN
eukprot:gene16455-25218_t